MVCSTNMRRRCVQALHPMNESDYLRRALELAKKSLGRTRPNPAVGAVVVKGGKIIGEGRHKKAGGDHAEVAAIKDAIKKSGLASLKGASIYVTLEPCSSRGKVGACTDAIALSGISNVVYAVADPNPRMRGKARRVLARHSISCKSASEIAKKIASNCEEKRRLEECVREAESIITPFAKHITTGLPYVIVKIAMSLDGKICDHAGNAKWISSQRSRNMTGRMRGYVDAIMVGGQTVRRDNPSLLCHQKKHDSLIRVVVSRSGDLPKKAQIFTDGAPNKTLVFDDAVKAIKELGKAGITSVLCEGGLDLARSLAQEGLVDEWHTILSPIVIGARPIGKAMRFSNGACEMSDVAVGDVHAFSSASGKVFL